MKSKTLRCDKCGRFISEEDIILKQAWNGYAFDYNSNNCNYEIFCRKHNYHSKPLFDTLVFYFLKFCRSFFPN
jgi:hypothetical protein